MEADDDFFVGYLSVEHDACAVLLGSAMRYSIQFWSESVDFIAVEDDRLQWFMYRSWSTFDATERCVDMPLQWECCVATNGT